MSAVLVTKVEPRNREGKKPDASVFLSDGTKAWCGDQEAAVALKVGEPLPQGWERSEGDYGPRVSPPRKGGGGGATAWRNTKEGAAYEREGWAIKEERSDRRTALMQAVAFCAPDPSGEVMLGFADDFYAWLRITSGSVPPTPLGTTATARTPTAAGKPHPSPAPKPSGSGGDAAIPAAPRCPVCGSEDIGYSPKRGVNVCGACNQDWKNE